MVFRDKYFHLAGDLPNATAFWGVLSSCPSDPNDGTTATCNGNGDGYIDNDSSDGDDAHEPTRAWQHLANAGLIKGVYEGRYYGGNNLRTAGTGLAQNDNFFVIWGTSGIHVEAFSINGNANSFSIPLSNYMRVGSINTSGGLDGAITSVEETWSIDKKIDDGNPRSGQMFLAAKYYWWDNSGFESCVDSTDTEYNLALGNQLNISERGAGCHFLHKW